METMSMHIPTETMTVLWLVAGAVALWMWLPAVLNALGLTLMQVSMDNDAAALEPSGSDAAYEALFAQLRGLGFVPVGRRNKTCWFFCHHWYRKFQTRVFVVPRGDRVAETYQQLPGSVTLTEFKNVPQGDCMAVMFKLWPWEPWRLYFLTAFSDGALVETANQMESLRIDEPDYVRWGLATPDRGLLLERHREVCRSFAAGGSRRVAVLPVEEINRLERRLSSRYHRQHHRWTGLIFMSLSLCCFGMGWLCLGIGLLLVGRFGDTTPYLVPASVIAWGMLWPAVQAWLFRATAGHLRAEENAGCQRNPPTRRPLDGGAL
jgi:hypothetical protein